MVLVIFYGCRKSRVRFAALTLVSPFIPLCQRESQQVVMAKDLLGFRSQGEPGRTKAAELGG